MNRSQRRRLARGSVIATGLTIATAGTAAAYFAASSTPKSTSATADSLPTGPTPSAGVSGSTVTLSFGAVTTTSGVQITAFDVNRYASDGTGQTLKSASCTATTCTISGESDGTWKYKLTPRVGTFAGTAGAFSGLAAVDTTAPSVVSINRASASPTNSNALSWTVTFSESVTGVDSTDFALARGAGVTGGSISGVSGSGTTYTVTATGATGSGTVGLNLTDDDSISDAAANKLGGTGAGNGSFTGQTYALDTVAPTVSSINRVGTSPTNGSSLSWTVTFSESVTGVDSTDFTLAASNVTNPSITNVTGSGTTYTVTASSGSGDGTLGLNLVDNDSIVDTVLNKLGGTGAGNGSFTGQAYATDHTAPMATWTSADGGGTAGKLENGDTFTVTFNEAMDTTTFQGPVTITITDGGSNNDSLSISGLFASAVSMADKGYAASGGASAQASVAWSTDKLVATIKVTSVSGAPTSGGKTTFSFTAVSGITDSAGNALTAAVAGPTTSGGVKVF